MKEEEETRFKEDPIWILLHGVRHNNHAIERWVALLLGRGSQARIRFTRRRRYFAFILPREVDLRRSAASRERERESKLYARVTWCG